MLLFSSISKFFWESTPPCFFKSKKMQLLKKKIAYLLSKFYRKHLQKALPPWDHHKAMLEPSDLRVFGRGARLSTRFYVFKEIIYQKFKNLFWLVYKINIIFKKVVPKNLNFLCFRNCKFFDFYHIYKNFN